MEVELISSSWTGGMMALLLPFLHVTQMVNLQVTLSNTEKFSILSFNFLRYWLWWMLLWMEGWCMWKGLWFWICHALWPLLVSSLFFDINIGLFFCSFCIDCSQPVMSPVDTSITSAGNTELSPLDIEKINCLYNCDGTNIGTCGGHQMGRLNKFSLHIPDNF